MAQKFVITREGYFRLGDVRMHKDLLQPGDTCIGGGFYQFDYVASRLLLDGVSYDFGRPRWILLIGNEITLKIPAAYRSLQIVYQPTDRYAEEDLVVTSELKIEYF